MLTNNSQQTRCVGSSVYIPPTPMQLSVSDSLRVFFAPIRRNAHPQSDYEGEGAIQICDGSIVGQIKYLVRSCYCADSTSNVGNWSDQKSNSALKFSTSMGTSNQNDWGAIAIASDNHKRTGGFHLNIWKYTTRSEAIRMFDWVEKIMLFVAYAKMLTQTDLFWQAMENERLDRQ